MSAAITAGEVVRERPSTADLVRLGLDVIPTAGGWLVVREGATHAEEHPIAAAKVPSARQCKRERRERKRRLKRERRRRSGS